MGCCISSKGAPICGPGTLRLLQDVLGMMQARNACREVATKELLLGLLNDPALKSFGGSPGHPEGAGADLAELHEKAGWFRVELEKVIEDFLWSLDIEPQTEIKVLDEEEKEKMYKAFTMVSLKTMESCKRKMTDDYDGDHTRICDVVRCSIVVETEEQLAAVLKALVGGQIKGEGVKVTVVRLKNRFAVPMFTGIMDCLLNVLVEVEGQGGHVCEIQLHLAGILAMKGFCHKYYEIFRDIFVGTAESYKKRLDMFEKVRDVFEMWGSVVYVREDVGEGEGGVEGGLRRLLEGEDVEKLQALMKLVGRDVLGDQKLEWHTAVRIVELTGEEETREAAAALLIKGLGQYRNKEYDAALVSFGKALEILIKLEGEGGTNVISVRKNIAMVYRDRLVVQCASTLWIPGAGFYKDVV
ncbi:hypothetical protein TeGR_g11490 [Tetraparma gracilis]|uniref:Uncharacterized protein n=1 Tax=Tetraparma gracilis TaxID=2962635 RepID=A0ABQ6MXM0_9STRA|nr:hypothetical protein TeGR_g11490 [Tetraparma gracilis]